MLFAALSCRALFSFIVIQERNYYPASKVFPLYKGLDPTDKGVRVFNFHLNTIKATKEMMEACGFSDVQSIHASKFFRRIDEQTTKSFEEIYFKAIKGSNKQQKFQSLLN